MDRESYEQACKRAADEQGITRLVAALAALGVKAECHQTGGFTMAAFIPLDGGYELWANEEGATLYRDCGDTADECELVATSGYNVAETIARFVRNWKPRDQQ